VLVMRRLTVTRPHQLAPSTEPNILCRIADDSAEREQPVTTYLVGAIAAANRRVRLA
jgi:hypothetical protein